MRKRTPRIAAIAVALAGCTAPYSAIDPLPTRNDPGAPKAVAASPDDAPSSGEEPTAIDAAPDGYTNDADAGPEEVAIFDGEIDASVSIRFRWSAHQGPRPARDLAAYVGGQTWATFVVATDGGPVAQDDVQTASLDAGTTYELRFSRDGGDTVMAISPQPFPGVSTDVLETLVGVSPRLTVYVPGPRWTTDLAIEP